MRSDDWLRNRKIAHRGVWNKKAPENSLGAFEQAVKKGCPIECDVRMSRDGEIVVFHDRNVLRMTGYDLVVEQCTYEEIGHLSLQGTDHHIPRLQEVLRVIDGVVPILIEIKTTNKRDGCIKTLYEQLVDYHGQYALASFDPFIVRQAKRMFPTISCGQHFTDYMDDVRIVRSCKKIGMYIVWLCSLFLPDFFICRASMLPRCMIVSVAHKFQKPLLAWCVKNSEDYVRIKDVMDNEICDPGRLLCSK